MYTSNPLFPPATTQTVPNVSQLTGFDSIEITFDDEQIWLILIGILGALILFAFVFHLLGRVMSKS